MLEIITSHLNALREYISGSGELEITIGNISSGNKQTNKQTKDNTNSKGWHEIVDHFLFVQQMGMRKCNLFCVCIMYRMEHNKT